jgi:hypothetical protein
MKATATTIIDLANDEFLSDPVNIGMDQYGSDFVSNQVFADQYADAVDAARTDAIDAEDAYYADQ